MGAVIASERFKDGYVSKKVEKWDQDIEQLSNIAKDEPQAACPTCLYNWHDKQISNLPAALLGNIWNWTSRLRPTLEYQLHTAQKSRMSNQEDSGVLRNSLASLSPFPFKACSERIIDRSQNSQIKNFGFHLTLLDWVLRDGD